MIEFPRGHKSFFVREITEPQDNALRIVIVESTTLATTVAIPGIPLAGCPMVIDPARPSLELYWRRYIAYSVTNESYAQRDQRDKAARPLQTMLQIRDESPYLRLIDKNLKCL